MRAGRILLLGAVAGSLAGLMSFAACGGSSESGPVDAGIDVAVDHYVAPVPDVGIDSPPDLGTDACPVDADLNNIMFPDATIGDSGATTADCYACTHSKCQQLLDTCNNDCACKGPIEGFFNCLQDDGGLSTCGPGLLGADTNGQNLGLCVYTGCQAACGLPSFPEGGVEGGGTDAPADALTDGG
jgi:hypothetical protein